jgi:hypothetical protein
MATPKEVSSVEISSTFDMIIIIWTFKKKIPWAHFEKKKLQIWQKISHKFQ